MSEEFIFWASLECVVNLEELLIKFLCFIPHNLFLLLIPLCRPLIMRWCIKLSRISAAGLDNVPRWKFVSEFCSFKLWSEHVTPSFSDGNFRLNVRMLFIGVVDCLAQNSPWLPSGCCDSHYSLLQSILVPSRIIVHSLFLFVENL